MCHIKKAIQPQIGQCPQYTLGCVFLKLKFLDPEHFVKGSYNIAFFFRSRSRRVTLLLPMLLVVYTWYIYIDIPHIRYWEPTEGASSPLRRQWRPLAAIWKNSLLKAYIHRYTPYEVLGAHRRRLEPPIRRQWRPLAAIWKNSLLIAYIHRYTPYEVLSSASPTNFSRGI